MLQVQRMGNINNAFGNMNANQGHDARLAINALSLIHI